MITTSEMYWLTRLDDINFVLGLFFILGGVATFLLYLYGAIEYEDAPDRRRQVWQIARRALSSVILALIVGTFIPTTKEMAAILVIPKIVNNEKVQDAGNKLYDLAVEWLEALKPEKNTKEAK